MIHIFNDPKSKEVIQNSEEYCIVLWLFCVVYKGLNDVFEPTLFRLYVFWTIYLSVCNNFNPIIELIIFSN